MTVATSEDSDSKVQVAVRVRPFNKRELDLETKCVVQMECDQTFLYHPGEEKEPKTFAFDHCFESTDPNSRKFSSQEDVFNKIGTGVVENAFGGYNACIFAYGQTGSGKSYTMMGNQEFPGIIPKLCNAIFERIEIETGELTSFKVEVSYMEIYNERVRDLLDPKKSGKQNLKVREHKSLGPMVDGLSVLAVSSFDQISKLIDEGNKCRTVAATNMNAESSRSHAVFTIRLTQLLSDLENSFTGEKVSKISLVDLAGSERVAKTGAMGKRLEEGGNINKSLTTLGMVISALAEKSGKKEKFVPYRDSVLTWLLKDNLGGNSKTVMIATISPAADNFEETLSTLRYADRAKRIVNHAIVNEDPNAKIIRELREEVETLRNQISQTKERETEYEELRERLAESERLVEQMNKSWEERLKETDIVYQERQKDLAQIGISVAESGIKVEKDRFYLVNLNADPSLNELLVYYVNQKAIIGSGFEQEAKAMEDVENEKEEKVDFVLQGLGIYQKHALLEILEDGNSKLFRMYISPLNERARICVNGKNIKEKTILKNGTRLLLGNNHFFRVNCPKDPKDENSMMISSIMDESQFFDYDKAWLEANSDDHGGQNISQAVDQYLEKINIKHQEEKEAALVKQYAEFERYIQGLTQSLQTPSTPMTPGYGIGTPMTPGYGLPTPSCGLPPVSFPSNPRNLDKNKFFKWVQKRNELFEESLKLLKKEIMKANALVREANMIADELMNNKRGQTRYQVTLQIPATNLRPSKIKKGCSVCEPVIVVKRTGMYGYQMWSVEQLENKLIDMREIYNDRMNNGVSQMAISSEMIDPEVDRSNQNFSTTVKFEHQKDFEVLVTEEFLEYVQEDALSIEVWGHRSSGLGNDSLESNNFHEILLKQKGLEERWAEVTNRVEFSVDIKELNENGEYSSVEVQNDGVPTGGTYQLKQGQQRRITAKVKSLPTGSLPLNFTDITSISIGSIIVKDSGEKQLDSYQEEDLDKIREQWTNALSLSEKGLSKTQLDSEREQSLINQWVALTEERNAVSVPAPNSNIPGAPAEWKPPSGIEKHVPVVFMDLNVDDMQGDDVEDNDERDSKVAGINSVLQGENFEKMIHLPILEKDTIDVSATSSWDSSIHGCQILNRVTNCGEKIYAIVKVGLKMNQPITAELVLRKRICLNVYKKPSFTERLMKKIVGSEVIYGTGVHYDIVAHIPKSSLDVEDRETLAMMAARHTNSNDDDVENRQWQSTKVESGYIEAYTKSIQAVEWMLKLDRLRQESAMLNMLTKQERAARLSNGFGIPSNNFRMKRTVSLPNTTTNVLPPIPPGSKCNGNNSTTENKIMETSMSSSSGYSSMVNSLVSPVNEQHGRLSGIDEEQSQLTELFSKEPVRSFTVPETLNHSTVNENFAGKLSPRLIPQESKSVNGCSASNYLFEANGNFGNQQK
ncbi:hypothetical protein FO519_001253 [Halicephalobus sp. NKZ332]|nr:hypothetical protein FO519_001253 [Halicephalobus sp. NKZ332]